MFLMFFVVVQFSNDLFFFGLKPFEYKPVRMVFRSAFSCRFSVNLLEYQWKDFFPEMRERQTSLWRFKHHLFLRKPQTSRRTRLVQCVLNRGSTDLLEAFEVDDKNRRKMSDHQTFFGARVSPLTIRAMPCIICRQLCIRQKVVI